MNITEIWDKTLLIIKNNISAVSYKIHMQVTSPVSYSDSSFIISVPSSINKNIINHLYKDIIESSLETVTGKKLSLEIIEGEYKEETEKTEQVEETETSSNTSVEKYGVNPKYTFENFVIGPSNEYAHAAALNAAEKPGSLNNPLFIYGKSGLGKTHLLHAIGNRMKQNNPNIKMIYVSGEKFTNEFIASLRENTTDKFKKKYREVDLLLLDDVQFLENKEGIQEEFFHTFNELFNSGRQIVLTSDRKPDEIKTLSDRLKTRFGGGIIIDVSLPNYETRVAILQKKRQNYSIKIEDEVLDYIAINIRTSIRELEGALFKIISMSEFKNIPITKEFAEEMLNSILPKDRKLTPAMVINKTAVYFNISDADIMSKIKTKEIAIPRQVAMYLCRTILNMNDTNIAREFNKDRSTVSHNIEKIENELISNETLSSAIDNITKDIKSM